MGYQPLADSEQKKTGYYLSSRERMSSGASVVAVEMGRSDKVFSIFGR